MLRLGGIILGFLIACRPVSYAEKQALAEDVFENIRIFKGAPAANVVPVMDALTRMLGVECAYCHVAREWSKDDKPQKQIARKMLQMVEYLNHDYFGGQKPISCWTCHRGHSKPPQVAGDLARLERVRRTMVVAAADESRPAEQVFHDIQALKGVPAGELPTIMDYFNRALGVDCNHCHESGHWERDMPGKQTARQMLAMVDAATQKFYGGLSPLGCTDCHQGFVKPEFLH